uniref:AB hydrolase-1 domain-containing protein n=1 Tax=Phaeomonas parva TaxID=124430 RepID=A0A7S1U6F3_9STRA
MALTATPRAARHVVAPATKLVGGLMAREHKFSMPLDWATPGEGPEVDVFVREVGYARNEARRAEQPALMYLQGGPGFPSPRPSSPPSGWLKAALDADFRVLLLDQRGTGKSSAATMARLDRLGSPAAQAEWLSHMRSDAIACDVEAVRAAVCGEDGKLSLLGQSFGGFCILSILSRFPDGVERALLTCGLAPVLKEADDVYAATCKRMLTRNARFYARYPEDVATVRRIVALLARKKVMLPSGGVLTPRRFLMLGLMLGSGSGMESLHWLLEGAWEESADGENELSDIFLRGVDAQQACFETNPIYWFLHESIYCNGGGSSSRWAAQRVLAQAPNAQDFDWAAALAAGEDTPVMLTGEMIFEWMAEDFAALTPLREMANILAEKAWERPIYDAEALAGVAAKVPMACLVSYDDIYVERAFSEEVARLVGPECKLWVTNEFQHSGLRDEPARVFETLLKMTKDEISLPS